MCLNPNRTLKLIILAWVMFFMVSCNTNSVNNDNNLDVQESKDVLTFSLVDFNIKQITLQNKITSSVIEIINNEEEVKSIITLLNNNNFTPIQSSDNHDNLNNTCIIINLQNGDLSECLYLSPEGKLYTKNEDDSWIYYQYPENTYSELLKYC